MYNMTSNLLPSTWEDVFVVSRNNIPVYSRRSRILGTSERHCVPFAVSVQQIVGVAAVKDILVSVKK